MPSSEEAPWTLDSWMARLIRIQRRSRIHPQALRLRLRLGDGRAGRGSLCCCCCSLLLLERFNQAWRWLGAKRGPCRGPSGSFRLHAAKPAPVVELLAVAAERGVLAAVALLGGDPPLREAMVAKPASAAAAVHARAAEGLHVSEREHLHLHDTARHLHVGCPLVAWWSSSWCSRGLSRGYGRRGRRG